MSDEFKYQEVLAAVRTVMAEKDSGESWLICGAVAKVLKTDILNAGGWKRRYADKLNGQVSRALNALADGGELVKRTNGRYPVFYTLSAWTQYQAERDHERQAAARVSARWEAVSDWLRGQDIPMDQRPGEPVSLSLEAWEKLLGLGWPQGA
jgi:hypothetical protein